MKTAEQTKHTPGPWEVETRNRKQTELAQLGARVKARREHDERWPDPEGAGDYYLSCMGYQP